MNHSHLKRTIATIGMGLMALGITACGEKEPVEVPDVSGMSGYDARSELQGQDFKTDMNALDGSAVFNSGNWEVESTDPAAGEMVEPKSEITVNLIRPEEDEPEDDEEEDEQSTSESETEFTFTTEEFPLSPDGSASEGYGTRVVATWDIETGFTAGMTERYAEQDSLDAIQQAAEFDPDYDQIGLNGYTATTDDYGNDSRALAIIATYDRETVAQINFDNPENVKIWDIRDGGGGCIPCG